MVGAQVTPASFIVAELQAQLDAFRLVYNEQRPHRAVGRRIPGKAYRAIPREQPAGPPGRGHFRLRYDTTDSKGALTLRRAGRLHHLKVGQAHARTRVLAIVGETSTRTTRPCGPPSASATR
jgi:hypothetical protein